MQSQEAAHVLEDVERLQRRARADLRHLDVPLIVFGLLMLGSAAMTSGSGADLACYWLVAAPVGILLTVWLSLRQGRKGGIVGSSYSRLAVSVVITVAAFAAATTASAVSSPLAAAVCPVLAIGAAYLILAWLGRAPMLGVVGACLLLLGLVLWVDGIAAEHAAVSLAVAGGASLLATGVWYWRAGRSSR
jgi:hypothetical protein